MNEDIHNGDENFKKAYRNMEEAPSPEVWGKISARLDNTDAVYYRNRLVMWKRIACILLLLIGSACAYEMFFNKKDNSVAKAVIENNVQKPGSETTMTEELSKDSSLVSQPSESRPSIRSIHSVMLKTICIIVLIIAVIYIGKIGMCMNEKGSMLRKI